MYYRPRETKAFTLIELLVVIAIIAILAAILLPAMNAAFRKAETTQAQTEIKSVETAIKAYYSEYSKFPHMASSGDFSYGYPNPTAFNVDNRYLVNVLRAATGDGNINGSNNTRNIVFIEVSESSLVFSNFCDPWGTNLVNQYKITVDSDFDNICEPPNTIGNVPNRNVIVWSAGPDCVPNTADDICSWK